MGLGDSHVARLLAALDVSVHLGQDLRSGLGEMSSARSALAGVLHGDVTLGLLALPGWSVVGHVVREVVMMVIRRQSKLLLRHGLLVGGHVGGFLGVVVGPGVTRGEGPGVVMVVRAEAGHGPRGRITALAVVVEEAVDADHGAPGAVGINVDGDVEETLWIDGSALTHWGIKDVVALGAVGAFLVVAAVVADGVAGGRACGQASRDATVARGGEIKAVASAGVVDVFGALNARREGNAVELHRLVGNAVEALFGLHDVSGAVGSATHARVCGLTNFDGHRAAGAWAACGDDTNLLDRALHVVRSVDRDSNQEDSGGGEKSAHGSMVEKQEIEELIKIR